VLAVSLRDPNNLAAYFGFAFTRAVIGGGRMPIRLDYNPSAERSGLRAIIADRGSGGIGLTSASLVASDGRPNRAETGTLGNRPPAMASTPSAPIGLAGGKLSTVARPPDGSRHARVRKYPTIDALAKHFAGEQRRCNGSHVETKRNVIANTKRRFFVGPIANCRIGCRFPSADSPK